MLHWRQLRAPSLAAPTAIRLRTAQYQISAPLRKAALSSFRPSAFAASTSPPQPPTAPTSCHYPLLSCSTFVSKGASPSPLLTGEARLLLQTYIARKIPHTSFTHVICAHALHHLPTSRSSIFFFLTSIHTPGCATPAYGRPQGRAACRRCAR